MKKKFFPLMMSSVIFFTTPGFTMDTESPENSTTAKRKYAGDGPENEKKKQRIEGEEISFLSHPFMNEDLLIRIASFLEFQDLVSLERVNKFSAQILRNAHQYHMLVDGWNLDSTKTFKQNWKDLFCSSECSSEYKVHFSLLFANYFPSGVKKPLPLTHYWKSQLSEERSEKICSIFDQYVQHAAAKPEWKSKAIIERTILRPKASDETILANMMKDASLSSTKKDRAFYSRIRLRYLFGTNVTDPVIVHKGLAALLQRPSVGPSTKAMAQNDLATMNFDGYGIAKPDYSAARTGFASVLNTPQADPCMKATAQAYLATMELHGYGIEKQDYSTARTGFTTVLNTPQASVLSKRRAKAFLATMDFNGYGIEKPDYHAARTGFIDVVRAVPETSPRYRDGTAIHHMAQVYLARMNLYGYDIEKPDYNAARIGFFWVSTSDQFSYPHIKSIAQSELAKMDVECLGVDKTDHKAVRERLTAVLKNPMAEPSDKIRVQYELMKMDVECLGIDTTNHKAVRERLTAVLTNPIADSSTVAKAHLKLAQMDLLGHGTLRGPHWPHARANLTSAVRNSVIGPTDRAKAQLLLAEMDLFGQATEKVNHAAARNGFTAVLENPAADPSDKIRAQWHLNNSF